MFFQNIESKKNIISMNSIVVLILLKKRLQYSSNYKFEKPYPYTKKIHDLKIN